MFCCKGICKTKYHDYLGHVGLHYNGQKRCAICVVYLVWEGTKCPCCNAVLHTRPRHSKAKNKYFQKQGVKWI